MNNYICKAKSSFDGRWIYGYYVCTSWLDNNKIAHLIIDKDSKYRGAGEFPWKCVHMIDPETLCRCDSTELMEG